jgi:hypothetical protein
MALEPLIPAHTTTDPSNRITLPNRISERIPWMIGTSLQAWLLLVEPGRYRLLSEEQVEMDPELEPLRQLILDGASAAITEPTRAQEGTQAAKVARLVPISIAHPKPGWRISLPRELDAFLPSECNPKALSILLCTDGYWEIWYTDVLKKAALTKVW